MSDVNLIAFGCAVSFIAVAGGYVYVRERFEEANRRVQADIRRDESTEKRLRRVA